jgi:DNA-3-methyladenine glycosylase I
VRKRDVFPCPWARNPLSLHYHDTQWGVPTHDDRTLFEFLILEGAQAGLSWDTILRKRDAYRAAYDDFDAAKIARYIARDVKRLLAAPKGDEVTIVRNRLKVESSITNARAFLEVQAAHGSFAKYIWSFVDDKPIQHDFDSMRQIQPTTPESDAMSKALKKLGFRFVGSTICYAYMQAVGMVNDHLTTCPRHAAVKGLRASRHRK